MINLHLDLHSSSRLAVMLLRECDSQEQYFALINIDLVELVHYFQVKANGGVMYSNLIDSQRTGSNEITIVGGGDDAVSSDYTIFIYKTYHDSPGTAIIMLSKWILPSYNNDWVC
jgi:hypothetical protein